jgi:hypothetical protein
MGTTMGRGQRTAKWFLFMRYPPSLVAAETRLPEELDQPANGGFGRDTESKFSYFFS